MNFLDIHEDLSLQMHHVRSPHYRNPKNDHQGGPSDVSLISLALQAGRIAVTPELANVGTNGLAEPLTAQESSQSREAKTCLGNRKCTLSPRPAASVHWLRSSETF
jgi:hypothetical protein